MEGRRQFLKESAGLTAAFLIAPKSFLLPTTDLEDFSIEKRLGYLTNSAVSAGETVQKTVFEVTGIHNGATPGGFLDHNRFLKDVVELGFQRMGHKTFIKYDSYDQTLFENLVKESSSRGIPLAVRLQSKDGLFDQELTRRVIDLLMNHYGNTPFPVYLQTGNEPELANDETKGVFYQPEDYAQKLIIPSIKFIFEQTKGRIKYITPPVAPNPTHPDAVLHGYTYPQYLKGMLTPLRGEFDPEFIQQNLLLGGNYYIFGRDQAPWNEIIKLAVGVAYDALGVFVKTVGTEWGLNQENRPGRYFTLEETASIVTNFLSLKVPPAISQILDRGFLWIYNGGGIYDFKFAELVKDSGEYNPVAISIKNHLSRGSLKLRN